MHFRYLELSWWFSLIFSIDDAIWTGTFKVLVNYWLKTTSFEDSSRIFKIFNTLRGYRIVLDHNPPWLSSHAWSEFYRGWVGASREKEQPSRTSLNYSAGNKLRYGISCLGVRRRQFLEDDFVECCDLHETRSASKRNAAITNGRSETRVSRAH